MPTYTKAQLASMPEAEREAIMHKYAQQQAAKDQGGKILQEQFDGLDFGERFKLKNLSDSSEDQARFLKKKYGDKVDVGLKGGQILLRNKGDKDWKVMDPEGFDAQDITDVAGDIGSGLLSGAATTMAGLSAGAATGGVGAIPAAMAAGGASSAGLEAIKQKLAQMYGVKTDDLSGTDIAIQGAVGAASPLLFGVGASGKQIAKAAGSSDDVARKLIENYTDDAVSGATLSMAQKETAEEALKASGEGLIPKLGRKTVSFLSGSDEEALRTARKMLPKVKELEKKGATREFAETTAEEARAGFQTKLSEVGDQINEVVNESGARFSVDEYRKPFIDEIESLQKSGVSSDRELADDLLSEMKDIFKEDVVDQFGRTIGERKMELANAHQMQSIKARLLDLSAGRRKPTGLSNTAGQDIAPATMRRVASSAGAKASKDFDDLVIKLAENPQHRNLLSDYKTIQKLRNDLGPKLRDQQTAARTLLQATNKNKRQLFEQMQEADGLLGTDLAGKAKVMEAFKIWNKPSWSAISSKGSTSTSRTGTSGIAGAAAADLVTQATVPDAPAWLKNVQRAAGAVGLSSAVSPAMQRAYFTATDPFLNQLSKVPMRAGAPISAWNYMTNGDD